MQGREREERESGSERREWDRESARAACLVAANGAHVLGKVDPKLLAHVPEHHGRIVLGSRGKEGKGGEGGLE